MDRTSSMRPAMALLLVLAVLGAVPSGRAAAPDRPLVSGPVTGGLRGGPWFASLFGLAAHGYVEREYFVHGTATAEGTGESAPFVTRVLVRRPTSPQRFNGTVVAEWMNVTGGAELEFMWRYAYDLFLREGYAFAAVSAQQSGVDALRAWDPVRYQALSHPGDAWSRDIFRQVGVALRRPVGVHPLGRLRPEHLLATGTSQSGGHLVRYANAVGGAPYDGFLVHSGDGRVRESVHVPVIKVMSPGDDPREPQRDTRYFRLWEEAGAAHNVHYWWDYARRVLVRDATAPLSGAELPDPTSACPGRMNTFPRQYAARAAFHHLDRWVRHGTAPPVAPRFTTNRSGAILLDRHGNTRGGIRLPAVAAPVATYTTDGGCLANSGTTVSFSPEKVRALYPTHAAYLRAVRRATEAVRTAGFLLEPDAVRVRADAQAFTVWD